MSNKVKNVRYKKPEAVKRLEIFAFEKIKLRHPNFPYPVKPKYRDDTANELTKCIIDAIQLTGFQAERINTIGQKIIQNGKEKWVKGSGSKGSSDIHATIKGKSVKIEIKIGNDIQSKAQKEYQKEIENAGGIYLIFKNFTQFYIWYGKFLKQNEKGKW